MACNIGHMASVASASKIVRRAKEPADVVAFVDFVRSGKPGQHAYAVLLGLKVFEPVALMKSVQRGFGFDAFARLQRNLELSQARLLEVVQIPPRTFSRRRKEGRLMTDESDRLLRAGRVFGRAIELFDGDAEAARSWLAAPQAVLGGVVPWERAKTDLGAHEVESAIGRIEQGVFA